MERETVGLFVERFGRAGCAEESGGAVVGKVLYLCLCQRVGGLS